VNTYTTDTQFGSHIAMDPAGGFVVVWTSLGEDGSDYGVVARRYDSAGNPLDPAGVIVNTYTTSTQYAGDVGIDGAGNFIVVWSGYGPGSTLGLFGRRYRAAGQPLDAAEFEIDTLGNHDIGAPSMAVNQGGQFVVAWSSLRYPSNSSHPVADIVARRFQSDGSPLDPSEFKVNTSTLYNPYVRGDVGVDEAGRFVVTWSSKAASGGTSDVFARRFGSDGKPLDSTEFVVNSYITGDQTYPSVAMSGDGGFVVAWSGYGPGSANSGVFARGFRSDGTPLQNQEFRVSGIEGYPRVAADRAGDFVIAGGSSDSSGSGVAARRMTIDGRTIDTTEFLVNSYQQLDQGDPAVAMNPSGDFVVTWDSDYQDGSSWGVFGQRFACNDLDGDGICDALDIVITSHANGDVAACGHPSDVNSLPVFSWQRGNFGSFQATISWDPTFAKGERITSGRVPLRRNSWKPSVRQWIRACHNAGAHLYLRVFGVDRAVGRHDPNRTTYSNAVFLNPSFL